MLWVCLGMGGEGEQKNHEKKLFSSLWLNSSLKFSSVRSPEVLLTYSSSKKVPLLF